MIKAIILPLTLVCFPCFAGYTGNDLIKGLEDYADERASFREGIALGYIGGTIDSLPPDIECMPDKTQNQQIYQVVINYMKSHPESWDKSASMLIMLAVHGAWPCKK